MYGIVISPWTFIPESGAAHVEEPMDCSRFVQLKLMVGTSSAPETQGCPNGLSPTTEFPTSQEVAGSCGKIVSHNAGHHAACEPRRGNLHWGCGIPCPYHPCCLGPLQRMISMIYSHHTYKTPSTPPLPWTYRLPVPVRIVCTVPSTPSRYTSPVPVDCTYASSMEPLATILATLLWRW